MLERFIDKTTFESQEDFIKNFKIKVPENFNFGYDVVDAWAEEEPDKKALCWTNDHGEHIDFTFADGPDGFLFPILGDRTWRYGDADTQTPL